MENSPQVEVQNPSPITPSTPPPATPPATPPPPPFGSRAEWRAWRRQERESIRAHYGWGSFGIWGWFWSIALILVGGYYLLVNLGLMTWTRGDLIWPLLLILLGVLVLVSRIWPRRA